MSPVDRVVAVLDEAGVGAEALGCAVGAIANSLVFDADGAPLLVLASGAHRVDTAKVAALVGAGRVRRATPEFAAQWIEQTDQPNALLIEASSHRGDGLTGIPTGFADLDRLTNGLHAGQMVGRHKGARPPRPREPKRRSNGRRRHSGGSAELPAPSPSPVTLAEAGYS